MHIEVTENAARHIREMLSKRGQGIGLRLGTRKSGCGAAGGAVASGLPGRAAARARRERIRGRT